MRSVSRLPPHSPEDEQCILGCVLMDPKQCLPQCIETLVGPEVFYDLRHQSIYGAMVEMGDKLMNIDTVTLSGFLKDKQLLEQVGGVIYISQLPDCVPSHLNLPTYMDSVSKKHLLRETLRVCTEAVGRIYDCEDDAEGLVDDIERGILSVRSRRNVREMETIKELTKRAISYIEDFHAGKGIMRGLASGFADLDKMTMGLNPGDFVVLCGYPSTGKTSFAMNLIEFASLELKQPTGVFSVEMTADSLVMRLLCCRARVNLRNVREGFLAERDFPKITGAAGRIAGAPIYIDDTSDLSIYQLRAKARRMVQQFGIKLFVVDYLQLMNARGSSFRFEKKNEELEAISRGLKSLAKELKVPVIVLSQLNDEGKMLGSRAPGQDGDHVWYLVDKSKPDDDLGNDVSAVDLEIRKARNGPTGKVHLTFLRQYTRFESAAKVSDDDVPTQERMDY